MAVLLAWLQWSGAIDELAWEGLCRRAAARVRCPGREIRLRHGRLWAARQCDLEADPLHDGIPTQGNGPGAWAVDGEGLALDPVTGMARLPAAEGGPHSSIWLAQDRAQLVLRRDVLGRRPLVYARIPGGVLVASGEAILTAHPQVSGEFDEEALAAAVALAPPPRGATVYRQVRAVEPGETVIITPEGIRTRTWRPAPDLSWRGLGEADLAARTRALLEAAVGTACRGHVRIAVSLSAGLDSSAVAALATRCGIRLAAYTHAYPGHPGCDEWPQASALSRWLGIEHHRLPAEHCGPHATATAPPACPDAPTSGAIRELRELTHAAAAAGGASLCLDGDVGDHLDAHPRDALADAVRLGRLPVLWREGRRIAREHGPRSLLLHPAWRRLASRALGRIGPCAVLLDRLREPWRGRLIERMRAELADYRAFPRPEQAYALYRAHPQMGAGREQWHAQRHGLVHASPWHDPALVRWMLSLPADASYRQGRGKWLVREALAGWLPEEVRLRPKGFDLDPFLAAARIQAAPRLAQLRSQAQALLTAYVDPDRPPTGSLEYIAERVDADLGAWLQARAG